MGVSIEPSLHHELVEHDRYRSRRSVSQCCLKGSYSELLSSCHEVTDFLEDELFFGSEFVHREKSKINTMYTREYIFI